MQARFIFLTIPFYIFIGSFIAFLASGCVSKVPGTDYGGSYCFSTSYDKSYSETIISSEYVYGRYKRSPASGNRDQCGLNEFYVLTVNWVTRSGRKLRDVIDVPKEIKNVKLGHIDLASSRSPHLILNIVNNELTLEYEVYGSFTNNGSHKGKKKYLIYYIKK